MTPTDCAPSLATCWMCIILARVATDGGRRRFLDDVLDTFG